jgi:hypothetical protein
LLARNCVELKICARAFKFGFGINIYIYFTRYDFLLYSI